MSLWSEFKEFAVKGNVIDLAVGFVIGGAFGTVVSSLVANVIMPPLGLLIGRVDFSKMAVQIGTDPKGGAVLLKYGMFVQACFSFLIIALAHVRDHQDDQPDASRAAAGRRRAAAADQVRRVARGDPGPAREARLIASRSPIRASRARWCPSGSAAPAADSG